MMLIKGKKAQVSTGRSTSHGNTTQGRPETQRHWPGLLPLVYQDPASSQMYFVSQNSNQPQLLPMMPTAHPQTAHLFKRELKMPKILQNNPSSSANHLGNNIKSPTSIQNGVLGRTFESSFQHQLNEQQRTQTSNPLNDFNSGRIMDHLNANSVAPGEQQLLLMQHYAAAPDTGVTLINEGGASIGPNALQQMSLEQQSQFQNNSIQNNGLNQSYNSQLNSNVQGVEMAKFFSQPGAPSPRTLQQMQRPSRVGGNINMQDSMDVRVRSSVENVSKQGGNAGTDQSPDHTQFTILKAKLFNPNLNNPNVSSSLNNPTLQNNPQPQQTVTTSNAGGHPFDHHYSHHSTSHHSTLPIQTSIGPVSTTTGLYIKPQPANPSMVPSHILNPPLKQILEGESNYHSQNRDILATE